MPRGHGIYRDEPRDKRPVHHSGDGTEDESVEELAPDDTSSKYAQEPPD